MGIYYQFVKNATSKRENIKAKIYGFSCKQLQTFLRENILHSYIDKDGLANFLVLTKILPECKCDTRLIEELLKNLFEDLDGFENEKSSDSDTIMDRYLKKTPKELKKKIRINFQQLI